MKKNCMLMLIAVSILLSSCFDGKRVSFGLDGTWEDSNGGKWIFDEDSGKVTHKAKFKKEKFQFYVLDEYDFSFSYGRKSLNAIITFRSDGYMRATLKDNGKSLTFSGGIGNTGDTVSGKWNCVESKDCYMIFDSENREAELCFGSEPLKIPYNFEHIGMTINMRFSEFGQEPIDFEVNTVKLDDKNMAFSSSMLGSLKLTKK